MIKLLMYLFTGSILASAGCSLPFSKEKSAQSKTIELMDGRKCTIQVLPDTYNKEVGASKSHTYLRMFVNDVKEHTKEDWMYIDFGLQEDVALLIAGDTLLPSVFHRVANGKKHMYEYIMAFETEHVKNSIFLINDKILGVGKQEMTLP